MPLDHEEVGRHWDENSEVWTELARAGYDAYRDGFNTPAFLEMLPDVEGLSGLDLGCGEGHNTRLVAGRGARMVGVDISENFVRHAAEAEEADPLGIRYGRANAADLSFEDAGFDFVVAFMPHGHAAGGGGTRRGLPGRAARRFLAVLDRAPVLHHPPPQDPPRRARAGVRARGRGYFREGEGETQEWIFSSAPPEVREGRRPFRVPRFTRPLGRWLNLLIEDEPGLERFGEPYPSDEAVRLRPGLQSAQVAAFLHVRARKPVAGTRAPVETPRSSRS